MSLLRTRWAAVGAAVAVTLGAGGVVAADALSAGERVVFVPITPCRILDTRPTDQVGPRSTPLGANDTYTVTGRGPTGACDLPTSAAALSLNMTAVGATASSFLTVWAADAPRPAASSLNPSPGGPPTPNAVAVDLSADGRFSIYNLAGTVHVLADVNGYYVDHDHDDRYHTKAETGARIVATGFFNAGTAIINELRTSAGVTVTASIPQAGRTTLVVTGADTADTPLVLVTPHGVQQRTCNTRLLQTTSATVMTVTVECFDGAGAPTDTPFTFLVVD